MRRLIDHPPKFPHEVLGQLTRATINTTAEWEPFTFTPPSYDPCPVCGETAYPQDCISTILNLEFKSGTEYPFVLWSHKKCLYSCTETGEPDAELE
jgi:hypothetical protein